MRDFYLLFLFYHKLNWIVIFHFKFYDRKIAHKIQLKSAQKPSIRVNVLMINKTPSLLWNHSNVVRNYIAWYNGLHATKQKKKTWKKINLTIFVIGGINVAGFINTSGQHDWIYSTAETILGRHSTLEVRSIHLGGLFHAEEEIQMTSTMANFVGQMQGFVYNGQRYMLLVLRLILWLHF